MSQKISQKSTPPILISLLSCYDKCQDSGNWNVLILQKAAKKQESAIFNTNLQSYDRFCWQSFARLECPIYFLTFLLMYSLSLILLIIILWLQFLSYLMATILNGYFLFYAEEFVILINSIFRLWLVLLHEAWQSINFWIGP